VGGLVASPERYDLYLDGSVVDIQGGVLKIAPQMVEAVIIAIHYTDASTLSQEALFATLCNDCYYYRVTLHAKDGLKVLILDDSPVAKSEEGKKIVKAIRNVIDALKPH